MGKQKLYKVSTINDEGLGYSNYTVLAYSLGEVIDKTNKAIKMWQKETGLPVKDRENEIIDEIEVVAKIDII